MLAVDRSITNLPPVPIRLRLQASDGSWQWRTHAPRPCEQVLAVPARLSATPVGVHARTGRSVAPHSTAKHHTDID